ncbi:hypothetical protein [Cupriavidus basilensis]|uniref:hypothetical protein n=1 Tax=Cupriavidus basilensis TaxID=68895 RepID=UPI00157AD768|nr:hypothetical protein [Cupriavidus basilensis]NUA30180.1 hypothetical protein [Cupriavidus basilensis]
MNELQYVQFAGWMAGAGMLSAMAGAFLGGLVYSLTRNVWEHVGEVLAEKVDASNARRVQELSARLWRLKRGL